MATHPLAGRRVLVVEDDYFIATHLAEVLRAAGARVIGPVGKVDDAIAALEDDPEVAVLDLHLGKDLSLPVADELERRGVPYLFATASPASVPAGYRASRVCVKPYSDAEVFDALASALETRGE